jgi:cobalt-zinc-cadmium efflux system outer membrane protein
MRCSRAALAAAWLSFPALAWSEETARPDAIAETEFLAVLEAESAALRALREDVGLARADEIAARTRRNPRFAANREAPADSTEQLDLTLAWELPRPDRRRLAIDAAEAGVAAAESRLALGRLGVRLSMREAFARWAVAAERVASLTGFAGRLDELARTPDLSGDLRPLLPEVPAAPTPASSPAELRALEAELAAARLERELAGRAVSLPEIVGGWQRQRSDAGAVAEGPLLGLEWPLPLFDRGRAERARAEARIEGLEARLELARETQRARLAGASGAYERLRIAAADAAAAIESVEPALTAATASFRLGELDVTGLLETLRAGSNARLEALELRAAALEAQREVERLTGGEPATEERRIADETRAGAGSTREGEP